VATVVLKLFQIVQPHVAVFGQKDAQQVAVIQRMVRDLMLDVEVAVRPIVRDPDGVALSSRNVRLSNDERLAARAIPRAFDAARRMFDDGQRLPEHIAGAAREALGAEDRLNVDYVEVVDPEWFEPLEATSERMLLVVAVFAGRTRLIDNLLLAAAR
jgi:pantoate--beta-alanine ligase